MHKPTPPTPHALKLSSQQFTNARTDEREIIDCAWEDMNTKLQTVLERNKKVRGKEKRRIQQEMLFEQGGGRAGGGGTIVVRNSQEVERGLKHEASNEQENRFIEELPGRH